MSTRPVARDFLAALAVIGITVYFTSVAMRSHSPVNQSAPVNQTGSSTQTVPGNQTTPGIQPVPANQSASGNQTPADVTVQPADPAAVRFTTESGMVLHAVKPASVADYEAAIVALQDAFSKSADDDVKRVASGWRVWKATEPDAKANVIYVHMFVPTSADVDYRPSLWLDQLLAGAPAELLAKYRDSFGVPPSKLSLTEFANMSMAPAVPANVSPAAPADATPPKPGNGSPP